MTHVRVKPAREGESLSHPLDGPLPAEGGLWREDQFTFRRLRDGDVVEIDEPPAQAEPASTDPDASPPAGDEPKPALPAPAEPAADRRVTPAPGTVASVPFMITTAMRRRLRALGKDDDEIAGMKPEDAQSILAAADAAPATDGPSAADTPKE